MEKFSNGSGKYDRIHKATVFLHVYEIRWKETHFTGMGSASEVKG